MNIGVMLRSIGEPGGISVYSRNLLDSLLPMDSSNTYRLLYRHPEDRGRYAGMENVEEVVLAAPSKVVWDQVVVPLHAARHDIDVLFHPKLTVPLLAPCNTVLVMHGAEQFVVPDVFQWYDRLYFSLANPLYCRAASAVVVMTDQGAEDVVEYMGADPARVHAIPESYNEDCAPLTESEARRRTGEYDLPERFILFVGGITPLKNFGNLLRAYRRICGDVPHQLVAAGFKRWKYSEDFALIEELGLEERVHFLGFVSDRELVGLYNRAEVFVMPSLYEGFGMPALEAMACGCPVVTTRTGCSPEVTGDAALLVDPYDPGNIADRIKRVLTDPETRRRLVERGFRRSREFSWDKCARETLELFHSLGDEEVAAEAHRGV